MANLGNYGHSKKYGKYKGYWDKCRPDEKKKKAIRNEMKGDGCIICGYDKCLSALALHHVNPSMKSYETKHLFKLGWDRFFKELDKCIVVCHNCHTEIHNGFYPEYLINDKIIIDNSVDNNQMALNFV